MVGTFGGDFWWGLVVGTFGGDFWWGLGSHESLPPPSHRSSMSLALLLGY